MPDTDVCLWNIQNFGGAPWGVTVNLRNRFIRDFVEANAIDVLLMMEPSPNSGPALDDLMQTLNENKVGNARKDWCVSLVGTALEIGANDPPANDGELTFRTDGRVEGYAVLWRSNRAYFNVLPGLNDIGSWRYRIGNPNAPTRSPVNLVTTGRPIENADTQINGRWRTIYRPTGGYRTNGVFPFDYTGARLNAWPQLEMATTGLSNPRAVSWARARRPAYVVLQLNHTDGTNQLCPVAVYHAPSNEGQAGLGTLGAGMSRELYVTNSLMGDGSGRPDPNALEHTAWTVLGGDFNFSVDQAQWAGSNYEPYFSAYDDAYTGGASCLVVPVETWADANRRTTVQLVTGAAHDQPINSGNIDDYYRHKIDLAFYRGGPGTIHRLPETLMQNGNAFAATLGAYFTSLDNSVGALPVGTPYVANGAGPQEWVYARRTGWYRRALVHGSWGSELDNWTTLLTDLQNGFFANARQAAEFFHIFVSDHMPLTVRLTVP